MSISRLGLIGLLTLSLFATSVYAQGDPQPIQFDFEVYNDNDPILPLGPVGTWDSVQIFGAQILEHDGLYYMFYTGSNGRGAFNGAIGYATSTDGYTWEKAAANPVFQYQFRGEYQGYALPTSLGRVLVEHDGTWVMYYVLPNIAWAMPTQAVYRATAPGPDGPWTTDGEVVLEGGERGAWNYHIGPQSIFKVDDEYRMYYTGFMGRYERDENSWSLPQMGIATSTDGLTFTHVSDAPSLPALPDSEWEPYGLTSTSIRQTDDGWELFYVGYPRPIYTFPNGLYSQLQVGYATSADGITWERYPMNPVITTPETGWPLLGNLVIDDTYFLYYDHDWGRDGISLMTGTITR